MANARHVMPMLSVASVAAALSFYRDGLGGTIAYRFPEQGEAQFLSLRLGDSEIGIGAVSSAPIHGEPQRPATGHRIELCIYVDALDAACADLGRLGGTILAPPTDQPWGERCAFLADPDGNIVMLVEAAPD